MKKNKKEAQSNTNLEFDGQHEDEEVLKVFRRHPVVMRKGLIAVLVGLLIGMIPSLIWPLDLSNLLFAPLGMALGGLVFFYFWIGWFYSVFIITDQRLIQITQKGFFNRTVADIGLNKIQSINYQVAGIQETLLGFGTILVQTFVGDMVMDTIHHPAVVQEEISKIIKELGFTELGETPTGESLAG
jgi:uncharacterized membrane protein YdbT with pleckstrin-like domain